MAELVLKIRPRGALAALLLAFWVCPLGQAQTDPPRTLSPPTLHASTIARLVASSGLANNLGYAFPVARELVLGSPLPASQDLTRFEENAHFVYAEGGRGRDHGSRWIRRLLLLKPSVFIVDDEVSVPRSQAPPSWQLISQKVAETTARQARLLEGEMELHCETLLPQKVQHLVSRSMGSSVGPNSSLLTITPLGHLARTRFLHVLSLRKPGQEPPVLKSTLETKGDNLSLTILTRENTYVLELPSPNGEPGRIAVTRADGVPLVDDRPLPSGVLPHDTAGIRLMEQWDADYRGRTPPIWDIGEASKELKDAVDAGKVRPGRAIDLCCGTGTDAIFLARQGFKVTAIDISPTALVQAEEKAQKAGAAVQWLLADALAMPIMEPFDFIYDRGCYHVVRNQNRAAYLETVRRLSRPGSQFLLLAARSEAEAGGAGPAGVTEQELRFDFLPFFDIEWLQETRLEANRPGGIGPPSWAALFVRKIESKPEIQ